jgi:putative glutamine amidotransferase
MTASNSAPIIGITTYGRNASGEFYLPALYIDTVRRAGGVPLLLPPGEAHPNRLIQLVDGLIFTGGGDIDPDHYKGASHPAIYKIDPERDAFELELARLAIEAEVTLLGICRGLQVLSVASGGKLLPHVPDAFGTDVLHRGEPLHPVRHAVELQSGSRLAAIVGAAQMEVVSWHHQAVPTVPPGWQVAAFAPDGVIEALEHEGHPWAVALQWHPEMSAAEDPSQQRIFTAFVAAAAGKEAIAPETAPVTISS